MNKHEKIVLLLLLGQITTCLLFSQIVAEHQFGRSLNTILTVFTHFIIAGLIFDQAQRATGDDEPILQNQAVVYEVITFFLVLIPFAGFLQ